MAERNELAPLNNDALTALVALLLTAVHFVFAGWLSYVLFGLAGGIEEVGLMTRYGGIDYAWTNLAWLPGGLLLATGPVPGFGASGFLLAMAGSGLAGLAASAALVPLLSGARPRFGRRAWRLWALLGLWFGWVPVPVAATLTYWYTVAY
jgi:hypothetical protein